MGKIMAGSTAKVFLIVLATVTITIPCLEANIGEYDEYLKNKAEEARRAALEAYESDPFNVTSELNFHVHRALREFKGTNSTRRDLQQKYKGPCIATNPIDRCWRCKKDWAQDRQRLAKCAKGFGRRTTGGLGGPIYVVTDPSDDDMVNPKPGTLRFAVLEKGPLWIIFARSMTIELKQELMVTSDKTIDGRGANVQIKGGSGITMQFVKNVIIHNLRIRKIKPADGGLMRESWDHVGIRTRSDGDAISIFGSSDIWIDHVSMADAADGLVDAIQGSTGITISNCHMTHHNDVMLFGASDFYPEDKIMQVTVAFNHFGKGLVQRMPRCRWGFFHVVNNDYTHWEMYAIGGSSAPTILSQGNRFIPTGYHATKQVTHRDTRLNENEWKQWQWKSDKDLLMNGAEFVESGPPLTKLPAKKQFMMTPKDGKFVSKLTRFSGQLNCKVGKAC